MHVDWQWRHYFDTCNLYTRMIVLSGEICMRWMTTYKFSLMMWNWGVMGTNYPSILTNASNVHHVSLHPWSSSQDDRMRLFDPNWGEATQCNHSKTHRIQNHAEDGYRGVWLHQCRWHGPGKSAELWFHSDFTLLLIFRCVNILLPS